ncbi:hypothetical protein DAEQUDRAFT_591016 [Daedalea quercina L-15889]|uniref:Uncharacterized protein n=1 Tax=Daedalea quercina L-15889 TaxID=1314783 RepID=A0A165SW00_9APHY|nr:hypothetical protein DAEQUDRAFT_591016 [Daedalea quercina L-15889]
MGVRCEALTSWDILTRAASIKPKLLLRSCLSVLEVARAMCERESSGDVDGVDGGRDESHETDCASGSSVTVMRIVAIVIRHEILQRVQKRFRNTAVWSWTGTS